MFRGGLTRIHYPGPTVAFFAGKEGAYCEKLKGICRLFTALCDRFALNPDERPHVKPCFWGVEDRACLGDLCRGAGMWILAEVRQRLGCDGGRV